MKIKKSLTKNSWYSLIEILLWITIFSIVISAWFYSFSSVLKGKIKIVEKTNIEKESFYFWEKLFSEIKKWWLIDYEEYFNRRIIWASTFSSWHYLIPSWFWNYWSWWTIFSNSYWLWYYYCRSNNWTSMWTWGCATNNFNTYASSVNTKHQRYWQYSLQFIDFNSNKNADAWNLWDEDWNWNLIWDDDDENLWIWPEVFGSGWNVQELYLISWDKKVRTYFRRRVIRDTGNMTQTCDFSTPSQPTWSWCLWTIEILKLHQKDWGISHNQISSWTYDWVPDTWIIDPNFSWTWWLVAWSSTWKYWVPLFPDSINVKDVKFYLYPNKDLNLSWKEWGISNFSPYLRISYTLLPSRKKRWNIKWSIPELKFATTIALSDIFSEK